MATTPKELVAERFRTTLELFELGEAMLRQKLRRKHPLADEAEIEGHGREPSTATASAARSRGLAFHELFGRLSAVSPPTSGSSVIPSVSLAVLP